MVPWTGTGLDKTRRPLPPHAGASWLLRGTAATGPQDWRWQPVSQLPPCPRGHTGTVPRPPRRSVNKGVCFTCPLARSCPVTKANRRQCQACRLQKCLDAGMRKDSECSGTGTVG